MHAIYDPSIPRIEKAAHWKKLIVAWYKSKLTMKVFCQREQIKAADLRRWKYRLGKQQKNLAASDSPSLSAFAPLQLLSANPAAMSHSDYAIELVINQYCIRIGASFQEETLLRLITFLRRID